MKLHRLKYFLPILLVSACLEPFSVELPAEELGSLVVEGYINAGHGVSVFKLSRAVPVDNTDQLVDRETHAIVQIVNDRNERFPLTELQDGLYTTEELDLPTDALYRIDITLAKGRKYQSDLMPVKITPEIDSVTWEWGNQLKLFVHTHDEAASTLFYRWNYKEDWQIRSPVGSPFTWKNDTIQNRPKAEQNIMLNCWKSSTSKGILMASSLALQTDAIKFNIISLPLGAEETSVRYSVIVDQHALLEADYNYLQLMSRNSNPTGSFFDPMPSQLYGNVKSLDDPEEQVVGFVGVYTTVTKTLFIDNNELPQVGGGFQCRFEELLQTDRFAWEKIFDQDSLWVPHKTWIDGEMKKWMQVINRSCVDCRVYGSTKRPDYWD
jgi:Domain of unknown function (DUF4249)